jgi:hypothetical protein
MSTTLDIKLDVASQLGKKDGNVAEQIRDNSIQRARRKFYHEFPWSFLKKQDSLTFTSGVLAFPLDYDTAFEPQIFNYTSNYKTEYKLVALEDVDSYTSAQPAFAIDPENGQFVTNVDGDIEITYRVKISDTLSDTFEEPVSDITPIVALSVAYYWLAKERNEDMFKMFKEEYQSELARLVREDRLKDPVRYFNIDTTDYGYGE